MVSGKLLAVVLAMVVAVVMIGPMITTTNDNTGTVAVDNETITAQLNEPVDLQGYEIQSGSVTAYDADDNVIPASNYTVDLQPGEFNLTDTSEAADGEEISVTYDYQATDSTTETVVGIGPLLIALLALVVVAKEVEERL